MASRNQEWSDHSPRRSTQQRYLVSFGSPSMTESEDDSLFSDSTIKTSVTLKRHDSSAYCWAWSRESFLEKCPLSPSPICSPVSTLSCSPPSELYFSQVSTDLPNELPAPRNQISCIVSNDRRKSVSTQEQREEKEEEEAEEERVANTNLPSNLYRHELESYRFDGKEIRPVVDRKVGGEGVKQDYGPKFNRKKPKKSNGRHIRREAEISSPSESGSVDISIYETPVILPSIDEEEEEQRGQKKKSHQLDLIETVDAFCLSQDGYAASYESRYFDSEMERAIEEHHGSVTPSERPFHSFMSDVRRNEVEIKLIAWKEAKILKLMNKLSKKENAISARELKKITKARADMKEIERKMERKREKEFQKMHVKITRAKKEADAKKVKERNSTAKHISEVSKAAATVGTTGKLPWKLLLLP